LRLAQEIADLNSSLPIESTYAIFHRVDKTRIDMHKFMVIGVEGTPYAHGAFEFDFFFPNFYPQGPPKVQIMTTGGKKMWFNPNMYSDGKVCLSILGTHPVNSEAEKWNPDMSTTL
jgi:baculoviral IAP repeat-containing protein 6 (apollon)